MYLMDDVMHEFVRFFFCIKLSIGVVCIKIFVGYYKLIFFTVNKRSSLYCKQR